MSIGAIKKERFRMPALRHNQQVALQDRVIHGAKIIEMGDVNDERPYTVDHQTLEQVVELGSRRQAGMKARFTHPSMSDDGMGKYLGRWKNMRIENNAVVGDLHLADSASNTPNGDLAGYVMELAEESPDMFGVSVVIDTDQETFAALEDSDGERVPLRVAQVYAADIVDEPAATRGGLFDISTAAGLPHAVKWLLDTHFADSRPEDVLERFEGFLKRHYGDFTMTKTPETLNDVANVDEQKQAVIEPTVELSEPLEWDGHAREAAQAERSRIKTLTTMCQLADASDLLPTFIDEGFSVEQAAMQLKLSVEQKRKVIPEERSAAVATEKTVDENESYRNEYEERRSYYESKNVTIEQYIRSRRIDDGKEPVVSFATLGRKQGA